MDSVGELDGAPSERGCMKLVRYMAALAALLLVLSLAGCGKKIEGPFIGSWSYIHDKETLSLLIKDNGKAVLDGTDYTYTVNEPYLIFKAKDGTETKMRYCMDGEDMQFYKPTSYEYAGEGEPEGLVGQWKDSADKWAFEFTKEGTFMEDGIFPGYYLPQEDGSLKLVYNDHFPDSILYYTIEGRTLHMEYPWTMVKYTK